MMSMAAVRRRAEEFAAAADGSARTVTDAETQAFVGLVQQLRALDAPAPDPVFAASLRSQLLAAARNDLVAVPVARVPAPRTRAVESRRRRVMSVAASACIVAGSGMGVAAASQSALPGDALYPVKRGIENVGVSIAAAPADRGHQYVDAASTRLSEVQALAITRADDPSTSALIAATLDDFVTQADDGAQQLLTAYSQGSSPQSIVELRTFTKDSVQQLEVLRPTVPSDARVDLLMAARTLTRIDAAARDACPACSTLAPITLSGVFSDLRQHAPTPAPVVPPAQTDPSPAQHHHSTASHRQHPQRHHTTHGPAAATTAPSTPGNHAAAPQQGTATQMPTPTLLAPGPAGGAQPTPTEFTAPPMTGPALPSIGNQTPSVPLPTSGLVDPSDAVPQILDPTAPVVSGGGVTLPLP